MKTWVTAGGETIALECLNSDHLLNCITYVRRRLDTTLNGDRHRRNYLGAVLKDLEEEQRRREGQ